MPRKPNARAKNTLPASLQPLPATTAAGPESLVLTGDRKQLYDDLRSRYELDGATDALLRNAVESLERAAAMAEIVTREGAVYRDRFGGFKASPAALLERDFRGLAARTLSQLSARFEE
jgi:hypothetical protein